MKKRNRLLRAAPQVKKYKQLTREGGNKGGDDGGGTLGETFFAVEKPRVRGETYAQVTRARRKDEV